VNRTEGSLHNGEIRSSDQTNCTILSMRRPNPIRKKTSDAISTGAKPPFHNFAGKNRSIPMFPGALKELRDSLSLELPRERIFGEILSAWRQRFMHR